MDRGKVVDNTPGMRREEFGATEMTITGETSAMAIAEQARALVQARFVVAMQRPRDIDEVRTKLLRECRRPLFAKAAIYHKPIGKGIEGLSIRFAEAAIRCMGNLSMDSVTIFDDPLKRIMRVSVTDIENNTSCSVEITIDKAVERSRLQEGQTPISARTNSQGRITYLVQATEDDLLNKQNALVSKALRTCGLRHVPGDIIDECKTLIYAIQADEDAKDPDAARKALLDAFAELAVLPSQLREYLGHDVAAANAAEIEKLRKVYVAVRDGEATWPDCLAHEQAARASGDGKPVASASVKDRVKEKAAARTDPKPAPAQESKPGPTPSDWANAPREPGSDG